MTKAQIKQAIIDAVDSMFPEISDTEELSETQNVAITDNVAEALESVNPTHSYPPQLK